MLKTKMNADKLKTEMRFHQLFFFLFSEKRRNLVPLCPTPFGLVDVIRANGVLFDQKLLAKAHCFESELLSPYFVIEKIAGFGMNTCSKVL